MIESQIDSEFLRQLLHCQPGERLPSLLDLSAETNISVGKLREQMEVARMLGLVDASPRRGITRTDYSFLPAVRLSLLVALAIDKQNFDAFSSLRAHLEVGYWDEAVALLTPADLEHLRRLVRSAWDKLNQARVQIPYQEHRELHLTIFRRLHNPFVQGLLEAYWDAYEFVDLNTYADYSYLKKVWHYHERIVEAICQQEYGLGKQLMLEHMRLLSGRGISVETRVDPLALAVPA
jgi:DNA-binding FadR family transcriptional regulator